MIERVFQTCALGLLPHLSGRTFSDVVMRGDHPSEAHACVGAEDICMVLVRWIVDIYYDRTHDGLSGRTSRQQ